MSHFCHCLRRVLLPMLLVLLLKGSAFSQEPTRLQDVVYGHKFGMALTMDVLKPAKPDGIGILFMVSGGWSSSQDAITPGLIAMLKGFTDRGETVFLVCHGSQPKFTLGEILPDIQRAVRFVRAYAGDYAVDPNRLGISGMSSGGHLSLMTGATGTDGDPNAKDPLDRISSRVQAVACFFPPVDFLNYGKPDHTFLEFEPVKFVWHVFGIQDKPKEEQVKVLRAVSPYYAVTRQMPPTLVIQGDADALVPFEQAERFAAKLQELQVPHQLIVRPGKNHGWPGIEKDIVLCADWFEKYLPEKPKSP